MRDPKVKFNLPDQWEYNYKIVDQPFIVEGDEDDDGEIYEIEEYEIIPHGDEALVYIHITNLQSSSLGVPARDLVEVHAEEYIESLHLPKEDTPDVLSIIKKFQIGETNVYYYVTPDEEEGYSVICAYFDHPVCGDLIQTSAIIHDCEGDMEKAMGTLSKLFAI